MGPPAGFYLWVVLFGLRREAACASLSVSVPDRVAALSGSCAVIPCSFPAAPGRRYQLKLRYDSAMLLLRGTAFSSEEPLLGAHRDFRGRTALAGDLQRGDCSVRVAAVTEDDRRKYEVWLKETGTAAWRKSQKVLLDVSDIPKLPLITDPGAVIEGQLVTMNCTVSSPCPSWPPQVQWKWERGGQESTAVTQASGTLVPQGKGQILSSLSFIASSLSQPRLRCEARYPGGRTVSVTKEMHVSFPPRDVAVHVHTLMVQEGASVLLSCSCKSDPPASEFQWWRSQGGHRVALAQRTHTVRLLNVSRGLRVGCRAQNPIGQADSAPTVINVQYKPSISPLSLCSWDERTFSCSCAVDANPRPAVTWSVNGSSPPDGCNSSVSAENGTLWATLSGDVDRRMSVACYAYNALGNDSSALLYASGVGDSLIWKVVPAVCVLSSLTLLFLLLLLLCHRCRRKTGKYEKHILNCRPSSSVYPGNLGIYQERMPLYINCTEVTHIYTNGSYQLIYQNCTPLFVRNKQVLQVPQRQRRIAWTDRQRDRQRDRQSPETNTETPVYLEII
ncbi:sialoadhesin isoform X1 [Anguilla anguilla]|uniref:sialoadhesin isoform X1 n=1 Tax=Anguilla anguilla TaxID=7936 RepID=UPI0015AD9E26|nr:sialoadhesin isoform X1 [Anguilla anguilla]